MIVDGLIETPLTSVDQISEVASIGTSPRVALYLSQYAPENDSVPFGVQFQAVVQRTRQELNSESLLEAEAATEEERLLSRFADKQSAGLVCTEIPTLLTNARLGVTDLLFLSERTRSPGKEELLNLTTRETLRHGDGIAVFSHRQLPFRSSAAAMLRYQPLDLTSPTDQATSFKAY